MIERVVINCRDSGLDYSVVTDNDQIEQELIRIKANYVRIDDDVATGSERIALAYERYFSKKDYKFIINVQGDEPLLGSQLLTDINRKHSNSDFDILTVIKPRSVEDDDFNNPNIVKAIYEPSSSKCLYFSRSSVPYQRNKIDSQWYQHIGVYSYKVESLLKFNQLEPAYLEKVESLEQLRALANGMSIGALESNVNLIGVDTPEDIVKVERAINE
jgi:3-deoxy-manno-octulosonate cytidylyltransferase (CMP-KDO synthetase)